MLKPKMLVGGSVLLVAILGGGWYWYQQLRFIETTDNAYVETDISHLSVKVPGYVVKTDITDNQHVEAGQLLAQLEDSQYQAKLSQEQAALDSAKAELTTLAAKVDLQQALITQAKVEWSPPSQICIVPVSSWSAPKNSDRKITVPKMMWIS